MNLDTSTWPELLAGWEFIETAIATLLIITIFLFMSFMFRLIGSAADFRLFNPPLSKGAPEVVSSIDFFIAGVRSIAFIMLFVNTLAFISGSIEYLLMTVVVQNLFWACVIFLLTELVRVTMYGPGNDDPRVARDRKVPLMKPLRQIWR